MPVRTRSGSSPIRNSATGDTPSVLNSPPRRPGEGRIRRGSLSAVEAIKQRARRGTTTSSDLSSEAEVDQVALRNRPRNVRKTSGGSERGTGGAIGTVRQTTKESTDLEEEASRTDSVDSSLSSELAEDGDSPSSMDDVDHPLTSSPPSSTPGPGRPQSTSPKRIRAGPAPPQALPPRQPIKKMEQVSSLSLALQAKRSKAANPFERFVTLSGQGDPNPLHLKIYAPFSDRPDQPFEVAIRRSVQEDNSWDRKISVVDTIGFSLWRYGEEKITPAVVEGKVNVNRWMLRMVEDGEVDYDFPALDRTKPMDDFASNNNRAARSRSNSKVFDEFALVEASEEQFKENEKITPNPVQSAPASNTALPAPTEEVREVPSPLPPPPPPPPPSLPPPQSAAFPAQLKRWNPVLGPDFGGPSSRNNSITPADMPSQPISHASPRKGPSKILKIHLISAEGYPELVALDVTTDTYLAEVLGMVCRKRNLDKAHHILKVSGTNVVAPLDRTVESLGERADIDLVRRRFGNDGSMAGNTTPGSTPPNAPLLITESRKGVNQKKEALSVWVRAWVVLAAP